MLVIVDYEMGNVRSVFKAFEIMGADVIVSKRAEDLRNAERLVLPGVGAFSDGMKHLKKLNLIDILKKEVVNKKKPFLGICLGMQLLARESEEFGKNKGLGLLDAEVKKFKSEKGLKIPHVGWNNIDIKKEGGIFKGIKSGVEFYFVHSFHMVCNNQEEVTAICDYGIQFTAAVEKDNIFATQFHPEKSQKAGLKLLENFLNWKE